MIFYYWGIILVYVDKTAIPINATTNCIFLSFCSHIFFLKNRPFNFKPIRS